jgi:uncharacterized protein YcnI
MTRNRRSWPLLAATLIVGIIGAWPGRVDAHASFIAAPATVPADSDVALTMNVPHERDDATFNVAVAIQLPEGWSGVTCGAKTTWTCTIGIESGQGVVRFTKDTGAAPAEDETFQMTVHAGSATGTAAFKTIQTYNTAEQVAWIGASDSDEPAPTLQVSAAAPTTQPATDPPGTDPPTTDPPVAATPTAAPTPTAAAATTAPSTTSLPRATTTLLTDTTITAGTTTSSVAATDPANTSLTLTPTITQPGTTESGGSNTATVVAIVIVILAAAGGGTYFFLRRRRPELS